MIVRLLAVALAWWLMAATQPAYAEPTRDFITDMTMPLATDPAEASARADREIARYSGRSPSEAAAAAYWVKAQASFRLGDNAAARRYIELAQNRNPRGIQGRRNAAYLSLLEGLLKRGDGDFAAAFGAFRTAQQSFIASRDRRGQALALQSVGVLYNDVGNGEGAIRYFRLAEETYAGDDVFLLSLYNNVGIAYQTSNSFVESDRYFIRAKNLARELGLADFVTRITLNIAFNETYSGQLAKAMTTLAEFESSSANISALDARKVAAMRARIALDQGDHSTALRQTRRALADINPVTSDSTLWRMHQVAYRVFSAVGLKEEALVQLEAVRRLDEADAELTASNRAALLSAQFQFDAQDAQINRLKAENLEREVSYQRTMTVTIVIGALLALGLLASLLATAIRARNRARRDTAELSVVNQRLEQALAAKTEFLASTSHELRTPLNGILGMTQILLADAEVAPRHRTQIELLHDAGSTMRALVDDILDVAKIEHGGFTINPKPTDVGALVQRVTRLFAAQADNAGLTLDLDVDLTSPNGLVDPDRLTQILFNLIGNALKFTPEGHVQISVSEAEAFGGEDCLPSLILSVRDSGIGIAPEWHGSVFDMFRQVDGARTRNYGGTGLGLAICRQLARAMGGDIALTSAPGDGSTFTVTLPWQVVEPAPSNIVPLNARHDATGLAEAANGSIVVVASDPLRTAMLSAIVRRSGMSAIIAGNGERIEAVMRSKCLTLLVDASAWPLVAASAGDYADAQHNIIIVGDCEWESEMGQAEDANPRVVAFSRNAIAAALADILPPQAHAALSDGAEGGIAHRHQGVEPKRSAPMSRK